jgi:HEAT repeat protein
MADAVPRTEEERYRALLSVRLSDGNALEQLVGGLYDESWRVRKAAANLVAQLGRREEVVLRVMKVLGDRDQTGARNAAAEALGRMGTIAGGPVIELLRHDDPDQRKFAADILAEIRPPEAVPPLVNALDDRDANVRVSAAEALGKIGGEVAGRALERALTKGELLLRLSVLEALRNLRRPPTLEMLAPLLEEPRLRKSAYRLLGLIATSQATVQICRGLTSESRIVRESALAALALQRAATPVDHRAAQEECVRELFQQRPPGLVDAVIAALEQDDLDVRTGALIGAAALRDPLLAPLVAEAANDPRLAEEATWTLVKLGAAGGRELLNRMISLSAPARAVAAEALERVSDPTLIESFTVLLASTEPELVDSAIRALGRSQSLQAVAVLAPLLASSETVGPAARALISLASTFRAPVLEALEGAVGRKASPAVVFALAKVGGAAAFATLRKTIRHPAAEVRAASAEVACELGGEPSLELLRSALADEETPVRRAAAIALGKLAPTSAETLLRVALGDPEIEVQAAAIEAAGESGTSQVAGDLEGLVNGDALRALHAVRALARLGRLNAAVLSQAASHSDAEVVKEALLQGVAMSRELDLATQLLGHARWDVRAAAARVLGTSGGPAALRALRVALGREADPMAREAISEAMSLLSLG